MFIDTIRPICDKAHERAETMIAESVVSLDAIAIAAERIELLGSKSGSDNITRIAQHIGHLADRAKRESNEAADELATLIDTVMLDPVPPAGIPTAAEVRAEDFASAHRHYLNLRAASDALPDQPDNLVQASTDAYCEAMDRLLALPAPDHAALIVKIDLIADRYKDFAMLPELWQIIRADTARLANNG